MKVNKGNRYDSAHSHIPSSSTASSSIIQDAGEITEQQSCNDKSIQYPVMHGNIYIIIVDKHRY